MLTLLNRTLKSTLEHDAIIRRTCVMAAGTNIAFKIANKLLQIETWLLLTAYDVAIVLSYRRPLRRTV